MPLRHRTARYAAALSLTGGLSLGVLPAPAMAAEPGPVRAVSLFPSNDLTVPDAAQRTGLRVSLPSAGCGSQPTCGLVASLNQLDGFDLDPRLALRFDAPVDPAAVAAATTVRQLGGGRARVVTGVDRVVYDAATHTVYAHPRVQLAPGTRYRLTVARGDGRRRAGTTFTTLSATDGLLDLRRQLDSGAAYPAAGIGAAERGLQVDAVVPAAGTTLTYLQDLGSVAGTATAPNPKPVPVPSAVTAGSYVFGSYLAPSWIRADRTIAQTPTGDAGPAVLGRQRLPYVLVLPAGTPPAGGWPVAVYGHGFGGSDSAVLLAAATNAAHGLATIGTDVVGHGFGPRSAWQVTTAGVTRTLPGHARGIDLDGNGTIDSTEGVSTLPNGPLAAVGSRDGLRQTVADVSALVRAVGGTDDPRVPVRGAGVTYVGQSFGGIYGTMLAGVEPLVRRAVLNVPGGPISEVARLGYFRPITAQGLGFAGLLNGGTGGFTESQPLRGEPPVLAPAAGSLAIQDFMAGTTWLDRPGSPESFAPLVRDADALFQVAYGDQTVPNPTSYTLLAAGGLFARTSVYRNDLTGQRAADPHGFLLTPSFAPGAGPGQAQVLAFLATGATIDPDGAGPVWEVPVRDPAELLTQNAPGTP